MEHFNYLRLLHLIWFQYIDIHILQFFLLFYAFPKATHFNVGQKSSQHHEYKKLDQFFIHVVQHWFQWDTFGKYEKRRNFSFFVIKIEKKTKLFIVQIFAFYCLQILMFNLTISSQTIKFQYKITFWVD